MLSMDEVPVIIPENFPDDVHYTYNALVEELTLMERHLRDGSWHLCNCVVGDSVVYNAGSPASIRQVIDNEEGEYFTEPNRKISVLGLGNDLKIGPGKAVKVLRKKAENNILRIKTGTGRSLKITEENEVLTLNSFQPKWKPISAVHLGERIAVPRRLPIVGKHIPLDVAYYLGLVSSDGSFTTGYTISFSNTNTDLVERAEEVLLSRDITYCKTHIPPQSNEKITSKLDSWMIRVCSKALYYEWLALKKEMQNATEEGISAYLAGFFDGDGSPDKDKLWFYCSSEEEATDIKRLLLRLGVISYPWKHPDAEEYGVMVSGLENRQRLAGLITPFVTSKVKKEKLVVLLNETPSDHRVSNDIIPDFDVYLTDVKRKRGLLNKDMGEPSSVSRRIRGLVETSRVMAKRTLDLLGEKNELVTSDIFWDRLIEKEVDNSDPWVYDFTVEPFQNFIANDIFIHNCNPEKHLPLVAGLASEGYGFAEDPDEKAFMRKLQNYARIMRSRIKAGKFTTKEADSLRAWAREMRHRIEEKNWAGEWQEFEVNALSLETISMEREAVQEIHGLLGNLTELEEQHVEEMLDHLSRKHNIPKPKVVWVDSCNPLVPQAWHVATDLIVTDGKKSRKLVNTEDDTLVFCRGQTGPYHVAHEFCHYRQRVEDGKTDEEYATKCGLDEIGNNYGQYIKQNSLNTLSVKSSSGGIMSKMEKITSTAPLVAGVLVGEIVDEMGYVEQYIGGFAPGNEQLLKVGVGVLSIAAGVGAVGKIKGAASDFLIGMGAPLVASGFKQYFIPTTTLRAQRALGSRAGYPPSLQTYPGTLYGHPTLGVTKMPPRPGMLAPSNLARPLAGKWSLGSR